MTAQVSRPSIASGGPSGTWLLHPLGGVALGDFVVVALGLLNTLFYFAALGF